MSTERERLHNLFPDLDFDPEALRARYRRERDRRLREDGEDQYVEAAAEFAHYADDDPYVDPGYEREPLKETIEVAIIGAGFSGLMTAARLKERGITDFKVIEAGGDFGGTWYWNRYPGAPVRHRILLLPAAARGNRVHAEGEVLLRAGDLRAYPAHRQLLRSLRPHPLPDPGERGPLARGRGPLADLHPAGRRHPSPFRDSGDRPRQPAQAAGHSRHQRVQGAHLPYLPLGLRLHRRRPHRRPDEARRTSGWPSSAPAPRPFSACPFLGEHAKALYVFQRTPSSVDLRGNKPTDRGVVRRPGSRLAARSAGKLRGRADRSVPGSGSGGGRLDGHRPADRDFAHEPEDPTMRWTWKRSCSAPRSPTSRR